MFGGLYQVFLSFRSWFMILSVRLFSNISSLTSGAQHAQGVTITVNMKPKTSLSLCRRSMCRFN